MLQVPVNVSIDFSAGFATHDAIQPGTPPVPVPMQYSIEMIATQMWTAGFLTNKNKLTTTVFHFGFPIVLDGHDCGPMIPDITPPVFVNLKYPIMWPNSKRKMLWSSSTVQHDGKKVACAQMLLLPLPMQTCGDPVSPPGAMINLNCFNTEKVGLSLADFLLGALALLVDMAIDYLFHHLSKGGPDKPLDLGELYMKEAIKTWFFPVDASGWAKWGVNQLAGFGLSMLDTDDDGNFQWKAPTASASIPMYSAEYDFDKGEGDFRVRMVGVDVGVDAEKNAAFGRPL